MANYTLADQKFMARAMRLARKGKYSAHPNPQVGAVLVVDNQIRTTSIYKEPKGPSNPLHIGDP